MEIMDSDFENRSDKFWRLMRVMEWTSVDDYTSALNAFEEFVNEKNKKMYDETVETWKRHNTLLRECGGHNINDERFKQMDEQIRETMLTIMRCLVNSVNTLDDSFFNYN